MKLHFNQQCNCGNWIHYISLPAGLQPDPWTKGYRFNTTSTYASKIKGFAPFLLLQHHGHLFARRNDFDKGRGIYAAKRYVND